MGKFDWIVPVALIGVIGVGGLYILGTKEGGIGSSLGRFGHGLRAQFEGYDNPFEYFSEGTAEAFEPGSKAWREIQKRIYEDRDDKKNKKNKKIQKQFIESYFVDDYLL